MRMTAVLTALLFVQVVVLVRLELCAGTTTTTTALAMWVPTPKRSLVRPPTSRGSSSSLWAIVPLQAQELENLVTAGGPNGSVLTASPTREQYLTYFGRTPSERYARLVESLLISLLGMTFSYFLSFVLGGYVATLLGSLFLFWSVLVPDFKARQRNWEFLMGRSFQDYYYDCDDDNEEEERDLSYDENSNALYGALWTGYIADVCVVESSSATQEYDLQEFQDYTMERDDLEKYTGQPYLLRTQVQDHQGRVLQIHARLSEDYLGLAPRMPVLGILLSHNRQFTQLDALTDLYVPSCQCWIGDYPYLNRYEIQALLEEDDRIWNQLQKEGLPQEKHEKSDL